MTKNLAYFLGFSHFLGIGPTKLSRLVSRFGNIRSAYEADFDQLKNIIGEKTATKFVSFRKRFDPEKKLKEIKRQDIIVLCQESKQYPPQLRNLSDPPICLYIKGKLNRFNFAKNRFFAIVGTRKPSPYGQKIAGNFGYCLSEAGFIIVSGMAIGIDTIAHKASLAAGGKTIAVLGCGVDIIYPAINTPLYNQIIDRGGLIISEFPPGHTVQKGLFIARNRLISGLSQGVMVVEGAKDSGSLITARYAAAQGKEVFAPPNPITSKLSAAPNNLIKQGAKPVTSIKDILEEFNLPLPLKTKIKAVKNLSPEENRIISLLSKNPLSPDQLVDAADLPISKVLNLLSLLEIKNIITKNTQGKYKISPANFHKGLSDPED